MTTSAFDTGGTEVSSLDTASLGIVFEGIADGSKVIGSAELV